MGWVSRRDGAGAVVGDAAGCRVDRWWVLGDLVLFGPRPAEVLELLEGLPGVGMLRGNTDRYVLTGEQPQADRHPNATFVESILTGGRSAGGGLGAAG
jgi:hypothetical protein